MKEKLEPSQQYVKLPRTQSQMLQWFANKGNLRQSQIKDHHAALLSY